MPSNLAGSTLDNYEKIIQNFWEIIKVYLTSKNPLFNKILMVE
jgi:hypothetical protein